MRTRVLLVLAGAAALAYGLSGLVRQAGATRPLRWASELVAGSLVHDLVLAPVVLLLLLAGRRLLPRSWWPPVAMFLLVGGAFVLVAVPVLVQGRMPAPDNPSLLPRDYGRGLAILLAATALAVAALVVARLVRRQRRP